MSVNYMHKLLEMENMKLTIECDTLRYIKSILMSTCATNNLI